MFEIIQIKKIYNVMLYVKMFYITNLDFFNVQLNNYDDSCSLTSSNAGNELYHREGMCHTESLKTD